MAWAPFSLGSLGSLMGLSLAVSLLPAVASSGRVGVDYWWTQDLYHLRLQADALSLLAVVALYATGFLIHLHLVGLRASDRSHQTAALMLAAQGCGAATVLSGDLIALVFFLELTLVCCWLLAAISVREAAHGLLARAHVGGLLVLGAALLMWQRAGDTSVHALPLLLLGIEPLTLRAIALLLLVGFLPFISGVPGHGWLPGLLRHSAGGQVGGRRSLALIPATLLLIVGAAELLRLLPGTLALANIPSFARLALVLGLAGLWWGGLRAWFSRELGALAVWLTVAQSGHLLIALGASASPAAPGSLVQAAAIALVAAPLAVTAVWSASSDVASRVGSDALPGLSGLFRSMPLTGLVLLAGGLSLAGLPPLVGFRVQHLLISGLLGAGRPWLAAAVLLGDLLLAAAVGRAFWQAFLRWEPPPPAAPASFWLRAQLLLLTAALLVPGIWAGPLLHWAESIFHSGFGMSP